MIMSQTGSLDNGIVQGDPLSMLLYLFYNAGMLNVPSSNREDCLGYIDDIALTVEVKTFSDTHQILQDMINREEGAKEWATQHNLKFEATKSVLIDFSINRQLERPSMELLGAVISPQGTHKFLGMIMDQELCWKLQANYATAKVAKWILAYQRLTKVGSGAGLTTMRQLYCAVMIPKMTYAIDVWYTPVHTREGNKRCSGSVGFTNWFQSLQRMASTAITGALHTMANDILDKHAGLRPVELMLQQLCHRSAMRLATLPKTHPLS